ncbi:4-(cytidine 5'-diphospho)-2-C-methyl-D-erythritol kinase [soil metagenome]
MNTAPETVPFWGRRFRPHAVLAWAPAKVNLFLEVLGKRTDGYHDLATLMLAVDLIDVLEIVTLEEEAVGLECSDPSLPTGPDNLIVKAAVALHNHSKPEAGAFIRVTKRIPSEAGLGGGSSDAATTLLALNELWGLKLRREELAEVAADVGSDVAFFLSPPAGWCEGRGERVTPEKLGDPLHLVIVKPPVGCSTAQVYSGVKVPSVPVDGTTIRKALRYGDPDAIGRGLFNRLQEPAEAMVPAIAAVTRFLRELKPAGVQMTGSGSAVFALCRDRREALRVADEVRTEQPGGVEPEQVYVVKSWPHEERADGQS